MNVKGMKPPLDLTNEVTIFVSTIGDRANFDHCIDALDHQDCLFRYETIDHVAPMSAAFQQMIDRCETPYYVQVDEDMILEPYAIRILHDAISKAPADRAIVCYSLWDAHIGQAILGVKIYRLAAMLEVPYRLDVPHCDVEQSKRLEAAGYTIEVCFHGPDRGIHCIGQHGLHYTPETAYEAYFNRAAKSRLFPEWKPGWVRPLLPELRRKSQADPTNLVHLYAFLGFSAGLTMDLAKFDHEKDFREVNHDFRRVQADMETALPTQLSLHVTTQCNLACEWCPRQTGQVKAKPDMKVEVLIRSLVVCPTIRSVCIAGFGEPLLCANLGDIIQEANRRQLYIGLITNGVLLADYAKVLRAWGVDAISISLNAATAEGHQRCNDSQTWDRVIEGVRQAVKLFPDRTTVSMVCHRGNIGEMPAFLDLAASLNVPRVDFLTILPFEGQPISDFWATEIGQTQQHEIDAVRSHPEAGRVTSWPLVRPEHCPRACLSPYVSLSVDSEGSVSPCRRVMAPNRDWGTLGDTLPPWRKKNWYRLRASLEGDRELPECCRVCFGNWKE